MNIINRACAAYDNQISGFDIDNIARGYDHQANGKFVHAAVGLASLNAPNPFEHGSDAAQFYYKMCYCHSRWQSDSIDRKVHRIRMLRAAVALASLGLENPFKKYLDQDAESISLEQLADKEIATAIKEDIASETFVPPAPMSKFFGILPRKE